MKFLVVPPVALVPFHSADIFSASGNAFTFKALGWEDAENERMCKCRKRGNRWIGMTLWMEGKCGVISLAPRPEPGPGPGTRKYWSHSLDVTVTVQRYFCGPGTEAGNDTRHDS